MIVPDLNELLHLIEELSAVCPDYRFGQIVLNLAFLAREDGDRLAWDLEDSEFIEAARKHLADWNSRQRTTDEATRPGAELTTA